MVAKPNNVFSKTLKYKAIGEEAEKTLKGAAAMAMQKRLEDNPNFTKTVDGATGKITFINVNPHACGICEVATVEPAGERKDELKCEEELGCPSEAA